MHALVYLRVFEAEFFCQLLAVGFANVLLLLESFLQSFALEVREDCSAQHSATRLPTDAVQDGEGVRETQHRRSCNKKQYVKIPVKL